MVIAEIPYKQGVLSGEGITYDDEGHITKRIKFLNNKMEGIQKTYYPTGQLKSEKMYKDGIWTGNHYKEYAEDGDMIIEIYNNGYNAVYTKRDVSGNMIEMDEKEKEILLSRIDNRVQEKELVDVLKTSAPVKKKYF